MNGIINIYKEAGYTSHDVVARLRGILKQKKIGHTGTLDPDATGVLPVCLGKATKLCDMLTDENKTYETVLHLGITTDTQDLSGAVLKTREVFVKEQEAAACIDTFIGDYMQVPPMYSALKINGKKLYELAREGKTVERKARPVHFYEIDVLHMELPRIALRVTCSKGTYIRTLCHDIGEKLGCGACMESLVRTRVGRFTADKSFTLAQMERMAAEGTVEQAVVPIDVMFEQYPSVQVAQPAIQRVCNGNSFSVKDLERPSGCLSDDQCVRAYDGEEMFIGIYRYDGKSQVFCLVKMFRDGSSER
ncbi:tRNA pseudouridine(55) synthase TruB [Lawsonibacter sp. OA9]|uniref:tRNA pseudouridine(55) synthase TruB n=1 Tax=Oscillospiraceae TaxID=216572 RepID=UPI001F062EA4|nr:MULTISPECIES: tRNA pseudouridine(55) synthase TruB [Oscillospiraceae]MCH1978199.1 tRNA pseudouridine(55) synthase TruB [Lawsonibacter sp. OA9]MCH1983844.1 tRNA pseudouridine(55) synthase TruB [Ruminococcus sp. OA3]